MGVQNAKAWGLVGHHIVAYIAEQHLTPEAKAKCEKYLRHKVTHYSLWMDYWRHTFPYQESTHWHMTHVNEDFEQIGERNNVSRDAVTQLNRIIGEMEKGKYHNMSDSVITVNLKYLIHLVGDLHCPSHVGYHKNFELSSPKIRHGKNMYSPHTFWDSSPSWMHPKWKADSFLKVCDTYSPKQIAAIQKGTPTKWGKDCAQRMMKIYSFWGEDENTKDFTPEQRKKIDDVVFEQCAYGGYRLAAVLNNLLTKY